MKIAFVGDIHGRVLHTMAVLARWQQETRKKLDLVIQVGDLGAYPDPSEEVRMERYVRQDPAELDFSRYLRAEGQLADDIRYIRKHHLPPIYFIRGNHEDFEWLEAQSKLRGEGLVGIDAFEQYHYVTDGTVLEVGPLRIAFLGGIQTREPQPKSITPSAFERLMRLRPGEVDILVTHDAPYGIGINFLGQTQGSTLITSLIGSLQPRFLIAGHYHHLNGPRVFDATTYLGLNVLVDLRDDGEFRRVQSGSIAIMDTELNTLLPVTAPWLAQFDREFDFSASVQAIRASASSNV